jgi:hypothetical protein
LASILQTKEIYEEQLMIILKIVAIKIAVASAIALSGLLPANQQRITTDTGDAETTMHNAPVYTPNIDMNALFSNSKH